MATETKNIFLFGITGNGKSTLANTLLNKNGNFERVFKESSGSISKTRNVQVEETEIEGVKYQIVDTIGISDTKLKPRQVVIKLAEACQKIKEGLTQILFVVSDKFSQDQVDAYNLLNKEICAKSRQILINHLKTCQDTYQFDLNTFSEKAKKYLTEEEKIKKQIEGQKRRFEELDKKSKKDIERDKENNKLKKKYENQQEQSNNE